MSKFLRTSLIFFIILGVGFIGTGAADQLENHHSPYPGMSSPDITSRITAPNLSPATPDVPVYHTGSEISEPTAGGMSGVLIARVSVNSTGVQGNSQSYGSSLSSDGRYIAFMSYASNLVPGDTNIRTDIFVHDRETGETTRVSVNSTGVQGNSYSSLPSLSSDGRYIAFESSASNLVPGDMNIRSDIFVHDRETGETTRVSVNSTGVQGNSDSIFPSLSSDGRYVAFYSYASNLVSGDTNSVCDIFVHDRETGETTRVSVNSTGVQGNSDSIFPSLSSDGRYVAFYSDASNLVSGDTNDADDIFVHDRETGKTTRVSVNSMGVQGNSGSYYPALTPDGRYVAFYSYASNLVSGDMNDADDIFVHDRETGKTTRVSVNSMGVQGNSGSYYPTLTPDGRYIAFVSYASNLVSGDTNNAADVFVHDRETGKTTRVSVNSTGVQGNSDSDDETSPSISSDGRYIAFDSPASNLVSGDTNNAWDIFVYDRNIIPPPFIEKNTPSSGPNTGSQLVNITGSNFQPGAVVTLINSSISIPGIVTVKDSSTLLCSFSLTGAPPWVYSLKVRNPDGQNFILTNAFTVTNSTPTITSVSPGAGYNTTNTNLTIGGTNFRIGVTASLTSGSTVLTGTNLIKTGTTTVQFTFPTEEEPAGKYNLTVTNIDGTTITKPAAFVLQRPSSEPVITRISPLTGKNNGASPITITGSGFRGQTSTTFTGITVTLENKTIGTTFTGTPTTGKTQSSKTLYYTLPLTAKPAGIYNLTVRNYDGSSVTNTSGFIITTTNPTVSAISPTTGYTTKDQPVTLTGTNFRTGAGVTLVNGSISYNGTGVTVASSTSLTCTFPLLTDNAEPGKYNLTVMNADGVSGTKVSAFTITTPVTSPVITRISPTSGLNNAGVPVTITGKNFLKPTVTITNDTMSRTAKATAGKTQSTTIIYYTLPLTGLEPGSYRVNVTNQYGLNATISFPVNPTKPTITKISPALGYTTGDTPITITGTNYRTGAEVNLSNATARLLATSTVVTPTTITCSVPTTGMTAGTYNLTVTNTDGTNVTKSSGFIVKNPGFLPTITGITPNTSANSAARAVTIIGTNFTTTGARVKISTDGYPDIIGTPTAGKAQAVTRLYYTLPLTGVPDGKFTLTVINKDGLSVTRSDFFTVTASKPTIAIDSTTKKEKISPVSAFNTSPVNITITGTNFRNGVQVNLTNMSAVVEGQVMTRTNTQILSQFSLSGIPSGKYNLTIRNTDGTNVTAKTLFDVKKPGIDPVISSITPASAFNGGNQAVTITGKYFNKPAVYLTLGELTKTATATAKKVSTTTTLYVTLPLTGVPGGLYDLTVRNADGASTTAEGIFWVTDKASVSSVRTSPVVGNSARMPVMQVPLITRPDGAGISIIPGTHVVVPLG